MLKQQKGVSLLEAMLALAIGATVLVLSLRMFSQYQLESNLENLRYNVDTMFQAMSLYYKANCLGTYVSNASVYNSAGTISTYGTLNPSPQNPSPPSLTQPKRIKLADLQGVNNYLPNWIPSNTLLNTAFGEGGFYMQFDPILFTTNVVTAQTTVPPNNPPIYTIVPNNNLISSMPPANQTAPPVYTYTSTLMNPTPAQEVNGSYIQPGQVTGLVWKMQVSVLLLNPAHAAAYQAYLQATCNSDFTGTIVEPCETVPTPAGSGYLVWERLPSNAAPDITTVNWNWTPMQTEFSLQYTHDQMYEMIPGSQDANGNALRYYLCGG